MHVSLRGSLSVTLLVVLVLVIADVVWSWRTIRQIEAENPPRGTFVALDGGRIHVARRDPPGERRADVVLLHGASGNQADMMEALGAHLTARGFRVFAVDRPGHGYSDRWPGSESPARQAQLIRAALEGLGVHHAIVVGHSLAGAVADNFAIDHQDFASGIVMISPVSHPWPGGIAWYYSTAAFGVLGGAFAYVVALPAGLAVLNTAVKSVFAPQTPPDNYIARTGAKLVLRPSKFIANAQDVAALKAFVTQQAPRETQVHIPVAIVAGDDSDKIVFTKIHSVASAAAIPGATLRILPGVGHAPHWANPQAIVDAVEDVFARSTRDARGTGP